MNESEARPPHVPPERGASAAAREREWRDCMGQIGDGDARALATLYDQTSSLVYGVAMRILRNEADAEEVASEVYTQVWRTASSFDASRGSVLAWLTTVARSRSIDRVRSRSRARKEEPIEHAAAIASEQETPERSSWLGEQRRRVREALGSLPPEQREAIEMAYFSDMTQTELAERLQQPLGTVKTRIRLGMIKLRDRLQAQEFSA
jgi:RNA polymerase sigma-70 factor (ECF subfamily)